MIDTISEGITHLLSQLHFNEIDGTIYGPTVEAQKEVPGALLAIANQSAEARDEVIRALIKALEEDADGGADTAFRIVCDVLGKLKAVDAIDTLVKYIDYQPDRMGLSLHHKPSVKGLIQIGEPAVPKIAQTLEFGKSVLHPNNYLLRYNAATALMHIGGKRSKDALERAYAIENDERRKAWLEFAVRHVDKADAEEEGSVTSVRAADIE